MSRYVELRAAPTAAMVHAPEPTAGRGRGRSLTGPESEFVAEVAHELRGPLTSLVVAIDLLNQRSDALPAWASGAVELLDGQVQSFSRLVVDLLDISRSELGVAGLHRQCVDLAVVLPELLRERGEAAELHIDPAATIAFVDPRHLRQIMANLLDNARDYAGGATRLAVERAPGSIHLVVDDRGPGLAGEDDEHIFERFHRGSAGRRTGPGHGLGLALVASHLRQHGGRVWAEGAPGGGARFTVELPDPRDGAHRPPVVASR